MGDDAETIRTFFDKGKYTFLPVRQKRAEIVEKYRVEVFPSNYLLRRDGTIALAVEGWDEKAIRATLDRLLAK